MLAASAMLDGCFSCNVSAIMLMIDVEDVVEAMQLTSLFLSFCC